MTKRIIKGICLILAFCMIMMTFGCSASENDNDENGEEALSVDIEQLGNALITDIEFADELDAVEDRVAAGLYGYTEETGVEKALVYLSSGATAEEIALFEAKDKESAAKIEELVKARVEGQIVSFRDYVPDEVPKLENCVLKVKDRYVALCVSNHNEKAEEIIAGYFK